MIRLTVPSIDDDDFQAIRAVLASGYLVQGAKVSNFEDTVSKYVGTNYAIAVSNCTAALHLSLLALDVRPGDLVMVTAYSWVATANVIELCGAQPIFVDIQPDTFNMDPACLKKTLRRVMDNPETGKRVKAIIPVHTFGQMADMIAILEIAGQYDIPVIEDAACALGAKLNDRQAGTWGKIGCFSFHPRKAITTGEGGMIVTNDAVLTRKLRAMRNHGLDPDSPTSEFIIPGFNYRMTEFQAALGSQQFTKLERILTARRIAAAYYDELLLNSSIKKPYIDLQNQPIYQSYVVLLPKDLSSERQGLIRFMKNQGVEVSIGTWHIPLTTYFRTRFGFKRGDYPITDFVFNHAITLPLYEGITLEQQTYIIKNLEDAVRILKFDEYEI